MTTKMILNLSQFLTRNFLLCTLVASGLLSGTAAAELSESTKAKLEAALADEGRSDAERARDRNRRPLDTLEFFGFQDNQKVVEIFPGGGWYTKLLAPTLEDRGDYVAVGGLGKALGFGEILGRYDQRDQVRIVDISGDLTPTEQRGIMDMGEISFGVRNVDLVLTFRNLHNLSASGRAAMYKAAHKALKRGGRFGVIDHTRRHMQATSSENWRRLDPVLVIKEATAAGFTLVDFADLHYKLDDELRFEVGRRSVRGNTDRFTLLFKK